MNYFQELAKIDFIFQKGKIKKSFSDNTVIGVYASANISIKNEYIIKRLEKYISENKLPFLVEPFNANLFKILFL